MKNIVSQVFILLIVFIISPYLHDIFFGNNLTYAINYIDFSDQNGNRTTIVNFDIFNNSKNIEEEVVISIPSKGNKFAIDTKEENIIVEHKSNTIEVTIPRLMQEEKISFKVKVDGLFFTSDLYDMSVKSKNIRGKLIAIKKAEQQQNIINIPPIIGGIIIISSLLGLTFLLITTIKFVRKHTKNS